MRNDAVTAGEIAALRPAAIVISPGPGRPEDAGITMAVIRELGARHADSRRLPRPPGDRRGVRRLGRPRHRARCTARRRRSSTTAAACSAGSTEPFVASRYHSLVVAEEGLPAELEVTARTQEDGTIMGLRHRTLPVHGVQFHPESILTGEGRRILRNFVERRG